MYYFIFEHPVTKRLVDLSHQIEDEVVNQGIAGEMVELTPTRSLDSLITDAHHKGYQTLVVVGGSKLVNMVASRLLRYEIVLGVIPLGPSPTLEKQIKVSNWTAAITALRQRRWQYASLGRINDTGVFLTPCELGLNGTVSLTLEAEGYSVKLHPKRLTISTRSTALKTNMITIEAETISQRTNLSSWWHSLTGNQSTSLSRFSGENFTLHTDGHIPIEVDGVTIGRTPATFSVIPKALRLIVAKSMNNNKNGQGVVKG